jgi:predicted DsbA family dithiol-disulfide isomerase
LGQEYPIRVVGRAYLLRPDTPKEGLRRQPRPGETDTELAEPLRSHARESSLVMRPPRVTPNTMFALEATEYAQQQGKFLEFHQAAYRAYWEDGKDLGDLAVMEELAAATALDWAELRERLEGHHYTAAVMGQYQEARQHGIQGIPTFLMGNLLFTGAHPYPVFQAAMRRLLGQEPPRPARPE